LLYRRRWSPKLPGDLGAITYGSSTPSVCTVGPSSGSLSYLAPGACTIDATQAADGYAAASAAVTITVTAPPAYSVTFDGNGATSGSTATETDNTPGPLTANGFSRTGYTFGGWDTLALGGGTAYTDGSTFAFSANATLYAQWVADTVPASPVTVLTTPVVGPTPAVPVPTVPVTPVVPLPTPLLVPTGGGAAAMPTGAGYWALSPGGELSHHGNAGDFGSLGGTHLDGPIVAMSRTADNGGHLLAGADGGVFAFGDATFEGSMATVHLNQAITSMVPAAGTKGYWLVAADGGVFSFGGAHFYGSLGATDLDRHIVGIAATPDGKGYWLVGANGTVSAFGDAKSFGSLAASATTRIIGIVADADIGYRLITAEGNAVPFGTTPTS
jgi:Listeria-Bacteroides repeat domain (List_Bact_rpt)